MTGHSLHLLLAGLPVLLVLALLALRVPGAVAASAGLLLVVALGFEFPIDSGGIGALAQRMLGVLPSIFFIMYGGILLAEMLTQSGAHDRISAWLNLAAGTRSRAVLLIGFTVVPLIESVIGWGVGVIVGVPLLLRAGLSPTRAATTALLGMTHNGWGSLGLSLILVEGLSDQSLSSIGFWAAVFSLPVLLLQGLALLVVGIGRRQSVGIVVQLLLVVSVMWLVLLATNLWISPSLGGVLSPIVGLLILLGFSRFKAPLPRISRATALAFAPYCLLIVLMLSALSISSLIERAELRALVTSPALWLMVTAAVTPAIARLGRVQMREVLKQGSRLWFGAFGVTTLFILFGMAFSISGMGAALASGAAELGSVFLWLVPLAGALAGYITVSNLSAASIVTPGTVEAALGIGAPVDVVLGAQNAASSTAILASPARVQLATTLAGGSAQAERSRADLPKVTLAVVGVNLLVLIAITLMLASGLGA